VLDILDAPGGAEVPAFLGRLSDSITPRTLFETCGDLPAYPNHPAFADDCQTCLADRLGYAIPPLNGRPLRWTAARQAPQLPVDRAVPTAIGNAVF